MEDQIKKYEDKPKNTIEVSCVYSLYDCLRMKREAVLRWFEKLSHGNGIFVIATNGSFHAYDVNLEYRFKAHKFNSKGLYPNFGEYVDTEDGEARDFDSYYLAREEYDIFKAMDYREFLDDREASMRRFGEEKIISNTSELEAFLDMHAKKSNEMWKLSRRNREW
jgi:hypothetical protein